MEHEYIKSNKIKFDKADGKFIIECNICNSRNMVDVLVDGEGKTFDDNEATLNPSVQLAMSNIESIVSRIVTTLLATFHEKISKEFEGELNKRMNMSEDLKIL